MNISSATVLAFGLAVSGFFIGAALEGVRDGARVVTVKGLAEREVAADFVVWPFSLTASGNELAPAQATMKDSAAKVVAFLAKAGLVQGEDFRLAPWRVTDSRARDYSGNPSADRYIIETVVQVNSAKVREVTLAAEKFSDLLAEGVLAAGGTGPAYIFTNINEVKPPLIAEATQQARLAAEQFAKDSGTKVGGIMRGSQGAINIRVRGLDYDDSSQPNKIIRVVTTIDYALER